MVSRTDVRIGSDNIDDTYYNRIGIVAIHGIWYSLNIVGNSSMSWIRYG